MSTDATVWIVFAAIAVVFAGIWMIVAKSGAQNTANQIGRIQCRRCGFVGTAKASSKFVLFQGVSSKLSCPRCKSEDWSASQ